MKTKRMLSLLLSVLLTVTLLPGLALPAMAAGDSGTCGDSVLWTLDGAGTLTISADEEAEAECWMDDYSETEHAPWYESRASVKEVIVDEGVLSLGELAFDGCFALKTVSLPDSLEYVGREVFRGCDSLSEIEVSSGNDYFYSDGGVLLGENCLYRYPPAKTDKYYCLPEDTNGSIWAGAFDGAKNLERLYIPELSDISFPVFEGCENLTKLYIGGDAENMAGWEEDLRADLPREDVTILYNVTAEDCKNDVNGSPCGENVVWNVKDGTLTISGTGPMADYVRFDTEDDSWWLYSPPWWEWNRSQSEDENREQITRLVIEEGVTTVGAGAFRDLNNLETVELPSTLTKLGVWAFDSDTALKKVEIPEGITVIPDSAFSGTGLEEVILPDSVTTIEEAAFAGTKLETVDLPESLTAIGAWAFTYTPLKRVDIPAKVTSIGERAFYECYSLSEFNVDEANTAYKSMGGSLFSKDGTEMISYGAGHTAKSYTVPDGVKKLHPSTFSYTYDLEEINLPDSLDEIGNWCFGHTGLKQIIVPPYVTVIHHSAFGGCEKMTSAALPARLKTMEDWVFSGDEALREIFFEGTEEQWTALTKEHEDETLKNVKIYYRYDIYCTHENLIYRPAVPHGCLEDGTIAHWECESCGGRFSDANAKNWLNDITDPAGHDYRSAVTLAPNCSEDGVRTWTCSVCEEGTEGHSYTEAIPATRRHHFTDGYCDNVLHDGVSVCGAPERIAEGTIEGGLTWDLDGDGMLHVRGSGALPDMSVVNLGNNSFRTDAPWWDYRSTITAVRIHSGVTALGNGCFAGLRSMKSLYVPVSVTDMSKFWTFFQCNDLSDVYYEGTREQWADVYLFSESPAGNLISIANPFGSGMLKVVDYIGNTTKHYEYDPDRTYTVTWQNEDGTVLETDEGVLPGTEAEYNGETPVKASDAQYTYIFDGWTPEPAAVTGDAVYTARFRQSVNAYTVTWQNEDGTEIASGEVEYGTVPEYNGEEPVKTCDAQYTYIFDGWTPEPAAVTGDAVYTARFRQSVNAYTVTWQNEDGTEIASGEVEYGTVPEYTGDTPVKAETAEYIYIFSGWTPEITAVTGAAAYTAVFTQEKKAPKYAVQITDASIVGATEQQPIPAGKLTVEVSLRLAETTEPETVRVIIVSYTEDGRFIGYYPGTLKKEADGAYTVNADIQNSGDIGYMRIMALSSDGWIPLAEAVELK